jgi:hypothetical protein
MASSFLRFLDHTQRRTTVGRTPLDEWSARRRDIYLTTHSTHNRQTFMPPVGFELTILAGERPQTYALDRAATGTGCLSLYSIEMKEGGTSICDLCKTYIHKYIHTAGIWWHAVEVHRYKLEDRGFVCLIMWLDFVHWYNPSGLTVTLGSTQPLMEMSTRNIFWRLNAAGE